MRVTPRCKRSRIGWKATATTPVASNDSGSPLPVRNNPPTPPTTSAYTPTTAAVNAP